MTIRNSFKKQYTNSNIWTHTKALLRFGDKYQAEDLFEKGKRKFLDILPDSIGIWDDVFNSESDSDEWDTELAIPMANLARSLGMPDFHLRALYRCAQLETSSLLAGYCPDDGTVETLCPEDLASCIEARQKLYSAMLDLKLKVTFAHHGATGGCCNVDVKDIMLQLWEKGEFALDHDPLSDPYWVKYHCLHNKPPLLKWVCGKCLQLYISNYDMGRQKILDSLDKYIEVKPFW